MQDSRAGCLSRGALVCGTLFENEWSCSEINSALVGFLFEYDISHVVI